LWWQLDTAYILIRTVKLFGGISSSRDFKERFLEEHYRPHLAKQKTEIAPTSST
jgi:hypothetical protein